MKRLILFSICLTASAQFREPVAQYPALPLSTPNPQPPTITRTVQVSPPQDFQAALNAITPGTNLVCSGNFYGNFYLPGTSAYEISGNCNLTSPNTAPALANISATNGVGWTGKKADRAPVNVWIENIAIASSGPIYHAVLISNDCDPDPAGMPNRITFSEVTVNGIPMADGQQNGMYLDGENISVINSSVQHWQSTGTLNVEAQAIEVICGPGPYLFKGNTFSGSSEDVLFAAPGASPAVPSSQIIPSDITLIGNTLTKDPAWIGSKFQAQDKNGFECKNCERVLIQGNTIKNIWPGSQTGEGILLTPRIGLGNPVQHFSRVSDVTIAGNTIQAGVGISVSGIDNYCTSAMACVYSARVLVSGNTLTANRAPNGIAGSYGWCLQLDEAREVTYSGNTCTSDGAVSVFVDTYPAINVHILNSSFTAPFGGQGVTGSAAFAANPYSDTNRGNVIQNATFE